MNKILIVDDETTVRYAFRRTFGDEYEIVEAGNGQEAIKVLASERPEIILMDIRMPVMDGLTALKTIKKSHPNLPIILMTAFTDTATAMESMKEGAFDYVIKPFDNDEIREVLAKASSAVRLLSKVQYEAKTADRATDEDRIVGNSRAIISVCKLIGQLAQSDLPALIIGETGVGKEMVARAIVQHSARAAGPFMVINCASLPETLIESELFGYESGAFTGAVKQRIGRFEQCHGGTLFLDEVGELPLAVQAKILRVLQDGSFERLGGNKAQHSNTRIVAATNRDLSSMVKDGAFRGDLFHRLNVFPIFIPPLRERPEDIPLLVQYFIDRYGQKINPPVSGMTPEAMNKLITYSWPGNVRELKNVLQRAIVMAKTPIITADDCSIEMAIFENGQLTLSIESLIKETLETGDPNPYHQVIAKVECALIRKALALAKGNQVQAAKLLGINRLTLRKKIETHSC